MIQSLFKGTGYALKGMPLLLQPGIRTYVIAPIICNFIFFTLFIVYGTQFFNDWFATLIPTLPDWLSFLEAVIWLISLITFFVIGFFLSLMTANIIAAPFNGLLSAAIERKLRPTQAQDEGSYLDALKSALPAIISELRKVGYYLLMAIPLVILSFIPVINIAAPPLWLLFTAWMMALEYLDYPMGNHDIMFNELKTQARKKRWTTLTFGATTLFFTLIPVLNFFIIPIAIAGATVMYLEEWQTPSPNNNNA